MPVIADLICWQQQAYRWNRTKSTVHSKLAFHSYVDLFPLFPSILTTGSRAKLKAKLEQLLEMGKGKGLGSGRKGTLTPRDVNTFYACNQLGTQTPESILNTLWYMVNLHFGIRGPQEHASMVRFRNDWRLCLACIFGNTFIEIYLQNCICNILLVFMETYL